MQDLDQPLQHLAQLVVTTEKQGTLKGWRAYIWDQAKRSGIGTEALLKAIEQERAKG